MSSNSSVSILVRMPNWLGDCIMAMPALRHLAESMPNAKIFLAGREQFRQLFQDQPRVSGFIPAPDSGLTKLIKGISETKRHCKTANLPPIDMGILFTNSLSTAAWLWKTGAKHRLGYNRDCRGFFLTHPVPCGGLENSWHFVRYYLWLANYAESVIRESETATPKQLEPLNEYMTPALRVGDNSRSAAAAILRSHGLDDHYAVIAPASAYGAVKDWPPQHYRTLVQRLNRELNLPVVVTGAPAQHDVCDIIARDQEAAVNLAGKTGLDEFAGLLANAALFVGGDSGGAHVAGALGTPTIVIFGITNPTRTRPRGARVHCIGKGEEHDVKLSTPAAREKARQALEAITPDMVMAAIHEATHGEK